MELPEHKVLPVRLTLETLETLSSMEVNISVTRAGRTRRGEQSW